MKVAGIDIGSRTIKLVVVNGTGEILEARVADTTFDPMAQCRALMNGIRVDAFQATGYGRHLFAEAHGVPAVSEIIAHAAGARAVFPQCRSVLDIGGQDTKAMALGAQGRVVKFEMNDRCAAGTGKFLEVMARAFGLEIDAFGAFAARAQRPCAISSMCTVFAESEATALMARGEKPANIAMGLHLAVAKRSAAMMRRVSREDPVAFTGGVARNPCLMDLLRRELAMEVLVPANPQLVGALGAALLLRERK
jgi:predicted CoA-substrate-specific enzyme activase